jgi:hypothetical protein
MLICLKVLCIGQLSHLLQAFAKLAKQLNLVVSPNFTTALLTPPLLSTSRQILAYHSEWVGTHDKSFQAPVMWCSGWSASISKCLRPSTCEASSRGVAAGSFDQVNTISSQPGDLYVESCQLFRQTL